MPSVSVIATVLNEAAAIIELLHSLQAQTRPPEEVVIVDGGSRDGTLEVLQAFAAEASLPVRVLSAPGANISRGRNLAIAAASGEVIASVDAGVRLEPDWLAELVAPFEGETPPDVVSGFFQADPRSLFERVLGHHPAAPRRDRSERFEPPALGAYRRLAGRGGYPEWLDYCEDLVFDFGLRDVAIALSLAAGAGAFQAPADVARLSSSTSLCPRRRQGEPVPVQAPGAMAPSGGAAGADRAGHLGEPLVVAGGAGGLACFAHAARRLWPAMQGEPWPERFKALARRPSASAAMWPRWWPSCGRDLAPSPRAPHALARRWH